MSGFGTRAVKSAPWVRRFSSVPNTVMGTDVGAALRCAMLYGQHHARLIGHTCRGFNTKNLAGDASTITRCQAATGYWSWHSSRRTIPRYTSRVAAVCVYAITNAQPVTVNLQITVDDGGTPDTNTAAFDRMSQQPWEDRYGHWNDMVWLGRDVFTGRWPVYTDIVRVELSNVTPSNPGRCRVLVEGYAVEGSAARVLQELGVFVFAEDR